MKKYSTPEFFSEATRRWFQKELGEPTKVQKEAWPKIAAGEHTLVSAPTGTGKTLTAFLVFIDRMLKERKEGTLKNELQLIYVSPLKALATDIRENLKRPLDGIYHEELILRETEEIEKKEIGEHYFSLGIHVAVRTGDTSQNERQYMAKYPPNILITTPESLYLLLSSKSGRTMLKTAKYIILDELHAVIDSKRGAHLMLSLARLDFLCDQPLQRIGLSATIEPLTLAAKYLSPEPVCIIAPNMKKEVELLVMSPAKSSHVMRKDSVWREIAYTIYEECLKVRSTIVFVDGRAFCEKLSYYMIEFGGEDFARVHHGSLSKEQRHLVEHKLKNGEIKLLIATASMELGIDVGEIDQVFQIGVPRSISATMQRLGRAGHRPGKVSVMKLIPRTAEEALFCGLTAEVARRGGVEHSKPPRLCYDILAQHLVSIASQRSFEVEEILQVLKRAYPFKDITSAEIKEILCMLAGDYEHEDNIPVRPRLLYDRIHERVEGDTYSRMLAVSTGGTIPDRGMYTVKTEANVKLGELEEEFVFESRVGETFRLGSFRWKIIKITKDAVIVEPSNSPGAKLPFWKGDMKGRDLKTSHLFGSLLRNLNDAYDAGTLKSELAKLGLDSICTEEAEEYINAQIESTKVLPSDKTIIVEHLRDENGNHQVMIHSMFGSQVNAPLALILHEYVEDLTKRTINYVVNDEGILLFPYDGKPLPDGLLMQVPTDNVTSMITAMLPATPVFNIVFRHNATRAMMMGVKKHSRQPLWIQRTKGAQMLEAVIPYENHPLLRETARECLEDYWDLDGLLDLLGQIKEGNVRIRELHNELPSPMSFLLRQKTEESLMYDYTPTPNSVVRATQNKVMSVKKFVLPDLEQLNMVQERKKLPADEKQLHTMLMIEGDLIAGEVLIPIEWLQQLAKNGQVLYIEPGLWIAAEQQKLYEDALLHHEIVARKKIILRLLRFRGSFTAEELAERYLISTEEVSAILKELVSEQVANEMEHRYYHKEIFERARMNTIKAKREVIKTEPNASFIALLLDRIHVEGTPMEQLENTIKLLCNKEFSVDLWENVLLPGRVTGYRKELLDQLLAQGSFFWKMTKDGKLSFHPYDQIDWDVDISDGYRDLVGDEQVICEELKRRGASFMNTLTKKIKDDNPYDSFLSLAIKGILSADSFIPVRYYIDKEKIKKAPIRQQISTRSKLLSAGRWDFVRSLQVKSMEEQLEYAFEQVVVLSRETVKGLVDWQAALEVLRVLEYTGEVRRGYFIEGLSGVQFIRAKDFVSVTNSLKHPNDQCVWLNALDPAQLWGKVFAHRNERTFLNVQGTYVAIAKGVPVMVFEKQGKVLRAFDESYVEEALNEFVKGFKRNRIFPNARRIVVKEYPANLSNFLSKADFKKEMMDYVLYR